MDRKISKIIAFLLVVGFCNARPQRAVTREFLEKEETRNKNEEGWQPLVVGRSADLSDNVRVNSRYIGNTGSIRKPYISYYLNDRVSRLNRRNSKVSLNPNVSAFERQPRAYEKTMTASRDDPTGRRRDSKEMKDFVKDQFLTSYSSPIIYDSHRRLFVRKVQGNNYPNGFKISPRKNVKGNLLDANEFTATTKLNSTARKPALESRLHSNSDKFAKNWPNEALQNVQDLHNYEKYTSLNDDVDLDLQGFQEKRKPSVDSSPHKVVNWLPVPEVTTNHSYVVHDEIDPFSSFNPFPEDSHPNQPLNDSLQKFVYRPVYRPSTEVNQNTVIHILTAGLRKPDSKMPTVNVSKPVDGNSSSPPNVHITFMSNDNNSSNNNNNNNIKSPEPFDESGCPTITIDSYTNVNNTIESKQGCNDLNIIINSHILNTNVFKPNPDSLDAGYHPEEENTKVDPSENSGTEQTVGSSPAEGYYTEYGGQKDPVTSPSGTQGGDVTYDVFQDTEIDVYPEDSATGSTLQNPQEDEQPSGNSPNGPELQDGPVNAVGQANDGPASLGAVNLPSLPQLSNPLTQGVGGLVTGGNSKPPGSTALSTVSGGDEDEDDEDEDDDDEDDMAYGVMESMTSLFSYFSYLNPFSYSIFSLSAAPFAAFTAGILGIAMFAFPWAFPGVLELNRSFNGGNSRTNFLLTLENIVKESVNKYGNRSNNEWKSKRRKRKR